MKGNDRGVEARPALPACCVVIFGSCEWSRYSAAMGGVCVCVCTLPE